MRLTLLTIMVFSFVIQFSLIPVLAQETTPIPDAEQPTGGASNQMTTLETVTVIGQAEDILSGKSELSQDVLQSLPKKNSSLTDTITVLPRVQIGEGQRTSENAGEILPSKISISGGRAYENNFSVDGVNQGSLLDPLTGNNIAESVDKVPSHPHRSFVHQSLIDSVTVYDSNIPARFGRFVGGVVDAKTRMPAKEFGGKVSFRTTQDSWTQFHIDSENRDDFYNSADQMLQPRFTKYDAGFEMDIPINPEMGLLAAYKIIRSELEIKNLEEWKDRNKTLENYFLKYAWQPKAPFSLKLTAAYTPSEEEFFIDGSRDSDIVIERGGYSFNATFTADLPIGVFELSSAYLFNENLREAPPHRYFWPKDTPSKDWGEIYNESTSAEGGYGDLETEEESLQLRLDLISTPVMTGVISHTFNLGFEISNDGANYERQQKTYVHPVSFRIDKEKYDGAVKDDFVICSPDDSACIDEEVYFQVRRVYEPEDKNATIKQYAAYLEDSLEIGPLSLRPGVRISHDDFMDNTNTAYRAAGSWDIFRNGQTVLIGGYNRYYGQTLLTYKLREAKTPYYEENRDKMSTNELSDWVPNGNVQALIKYKYSELDTPYSNEWNIGVTQQLFGGSFEINYLERKNKDQFAKELVATKTDDGTIRSWELNNNGSSEYDSVKVTWERQWHSHYLNLNYTYSDQEASNEGYDTTDDIIDEEDLEEQVWYDGSVMFVDHLPRSDYYRNHAFNAIYVGKLPGGFTFTNVANYLGGYEAVEKIKLSDDEKTARGIPVDLDVYEKNKQPDYWIFDWRLDWETRIHREQLLTVTLEIDNIFDRAPPVAGSDDTYELGRQVWVGMTYKF